MFRLINSHLQAYSLQVKSQDDVHTLGSQCVYISEIFKQLLINCLTPNDSYRGRTTPLTSKRCILYIYSTNIVAEYFKDGIYSPLFSL